MANGDVLEWSVPHIPVYWIIMRESRRVFAQAAFFCLLVLLAMGGYLAVESGELSPLLFMLGIAAAMLLFVIAAITLVLLAMRMIGSGYSYRLDAEGLSFRFCPGMSRPAAGQIPANGGLVGCSFDPFDGWAAWSWLREQEMEMEKMEERGLIALRTRKKIRWHEQKVPTIFLFCTNREQFSTASKFISRQLG